MRGEAVLPSRWTSGQAQMQIRLQPSPDCHRQDAKAPQDWGSSVVHARGVMWGVTQLSEPWGPSTSTARWVSRHLLEAGEPQVLRPLVTA